MTVASPRVALFAVAILAVQGCSTYEPMELPQAPSQWVRHSPAPGPAASSGKDAAAGVSMDEVARVAVLNNPDLKLARAEAGVTRAQAFSAGLLPDPQIPLARDLTATGAFSAGLGLDLASLVEHADLTRAAKEDEAGVDLNLLWQEWQTIAAVKDAFVRAIIAERQLRLLQEARTSAEQRAQAALQALANRMTTRSAVGSVLAARSDIERQEADAQKAQHQARRDLNFLLGLEPGIVVPLYDELPIPEVDPGKVDRDVAEVIHRRPDLIALQHGFAAEDARYRAALLAQFPLLNVGLARSRDNTGVYSTSLGLTISLPVFNRNAGAIRVEEATREKLRQEYQDRLDTTLADSARLVADIESNHHAFEQGQRSLAGLEQEFEATHAAFAERTLDAVALTAVSSEVLGRKMEQLNLLQMLLQDQIALDALLGRAD